MVPHKSHNWRAILDVLFGLCLESGEVMQSVNENMHKLAPEGAIDQLGHLLQRIIHVFAEAGPEDNILMAKWDFKYGFWRLDCEEGEERSFVHVLPQPPGAPVKLVVPTSLQMG